MQNILIDKPYAFVPPYPGRFWPALLRRMARPQLRRKYGIVRLDCRGLKRLSRSMAAGHGILLAPNHCRPCDPLVVLEAAAQAGALVFFAASAHLFMRSRLQAWLLRRAGAFSIYREGMDKASVNAAIEILENALRPLVLFPEGIITRTNERVNPLMEGAAFIARMAAKKRARSGPQTKVVIHPVALRYFFKGRIEEAVEPTLCDLERRLSWCPQKNLPIIERVVKLGGALLGLKEVEYLGKPQDGTIPQRLSRLIDHLLAPMEKEWLNGATHPNRAVRVKRLRMAILPDMIKGELTERERERRWRLLADTYLVQQLSSYPPDYVRSKPSAERILETVERFEEDLTDDCRAYPPMEAIVQVGEAIEISPDRPRGGGDPLMTELEKRLSEMIAGIR